MSYVRALTDDDALRIMGHEVWRWYEAKGWDEDARTFGEDIALIHSELSEALEAYRERGFDAWEEDGKPKGVGSELADVLIRLLTTIERLREEGLIDIDLFAEYRKKQDFNWTRPHRHGGKKL